MPPELEKRVDEVLDFRLAPNSRRKVLTALKRWRAVCDERGWPALILSGERTRLEGRPHGYVGDPDG